MRVINYSQKCVFTHTDRFIIGAPPRRLGEIIRVMSRGAGESISFHTSSEPTPLKRGGYSRAAVACRIINTGKGAGEREGGGGLMLSRVPGRASCTGRANKLTRGNLEVFK